MAQAQFTTHHGMVDILPDEARKWQHIESVIRQTAREFHFGEIRTPVLEQTGLIARGVGELTTSFPRKSSHLYRGQFLRESTSTCFDRKYGTG